MYACDVYMYVSVCMYVCILHTSVTLPTILRCMLAEGTKLSSDTYAVAKRKAFQILLLNTHPRYIKEPCMYVCMYEYAC